MADAFPYSGVVTLVKVQLFNLFLDAVPLCFMLPRFQPAESRLREGSCERIGSVSNG
jgi:hypothetical protein